MLRRVMEPAISSPRLSLKLLASGGMLILVQNPRGLGVIMCMDGVALQVQFIITPDLIAVHSKKKGVE